MRYAQAAVFMDDSEIILGSHKMNNRMRHGLERRMDWGSPGIDGMRAAWDKGYSERTI